MPSSRSCESRRHDSLRGWQGRRDRETEACRQVPVAPFRDRFEELRRKNLLTMGQLCQHMNWTYVERNRSGRHARPRRRADTTTGRRRLGLSAHHTCSRPAETIDYDIAVRLCGVLGLDPHEAGC